MSLRKLPWESGLREEMRVLERGQLDIVDTLYRVNGNEMREWH
jgi:hypothetical protein